MIALLLLVIFGIGAGYFATQNTVGVPISFGGSTILGVPLYIITLGALLLGIFVSWLISLIDSLSSSMIIHGKNSAISDAHKTIERLKKENHQLELENASLKGEHHEPVIIEKEVSPRPSLFHRFRQNSG